MENLNRFHNFLHKTPGQSSGPIPPISTNHNFNDTVNVPKCFFCQNAPINRFPVDNWWLDDRSINRIPILVVVGYGSSNMGGERGGGRLCERTC